MLLEALRFCQKLIKIDIHDFFFFFLLRHIVSSPADEEPEEDVSVEQLEEKAIGGDARAQARVSESTCTDKLLALFSVLQADSVWFSACAYFGPLGR